MKKKVPLSYLLSNAQNTVKYLLNKRTPLNVTYAHFYSFGSNALIYIMSNCVSLTGLPRYLVNRYSVCFRRGYFWMSLMFQSIDGVKQILFPYIGGPIQLVEGLKRTKRLTFSERAGIPPPFELKHAFILFLSSDSNRNTGSSWIWNLQVFGLELYHWLVQASSLQTHPEYLRTYQPP